MNRTQTLHSGLRSWTMGFTKASDGLRSNSCAVGCVPGWSCLVGKRLDTDADGWLQSGVGVGRVNYLGSSDEARRVRIVRPLGYFEVSEVAGKSTIVRNASHGVDVEVSFGNIWMGACMDELYLEPRCTSLQRDTSAPTLAARELAEEVKTSSRDKLFPDVDLHPLQRSDSSVSADATKSHAPSCDDSSVHGPDSHTSPISTPPASFARKNGSQTLYFPEDASSILLYSAPSARRIHFARHSHAATSNVEDEDSSSFLAFDSSYLELIWNSAPADDADPTLALL